MKGAADDKAELGAKDPALWLTAFKGLFSCERGEKPLSPCDAREESEVTGNDARPTRLTAGGDIGRGRIPWFPICCMADVVTELISLRCATSEPIEELEEDMEG